MSPERLLRKAIGSPSMPPKESCVASSPMPISGRSFSMSPLLQASTIRSCMRLTGSGSSVEVVDDFGQRAHSRSTSGTVRAAFAGLLAVDRPRPALRRRLAAAGVRRIGSARCRRADVLVRGAAIAVAGRAVLGGGGSSRPISLSAERLSPEHGNAGAKTNRREPDERRPAERRMPFLACRIRRQLHRVISPATQVPLRGLGSRRKMKKRPAVGVNAATAPARIPLR